MPMPIYKPIYIKAKHGIDRHTTEYFLRTSEKVLTTICSFLSV